MAEKIKNYDPSLERSYSPDPEVDEIFGAEEIVSTCDDPLIAKAFENPEEDDFDDLSMAGKKASAIFEAAVSASKKEEKNKIPPYARAYLKKLREQELEDDDPDTDAEEDDTDTDSDVDGGFDFSDIGLGEGEDFDEGSGEEFDDGDEFSDEDETEGDEDEEDFEDPEDVARTESWKDEELIDDELGSIMGTSPDSVNTGQGQGQHRLRPFNSAGIRNTATYSNTTKPSSKFDDNLSDASSFSSGGFIEIFDDGLLFVDRRGQSIALAVPDPSEEEDWGRDLGPSESLGVLLIKGEGKGSQELVIEISGEELDKLIDAFNQFKSQSTSSDKYQKAAMGVYERAKKYRKNLRKK